MIAKMLSKIFGTKNEREIKSLNPIIEAINSYESQLQSLDDVMLKAKTVEFKERLAKGATLDELLPEAFAVCREASKRVLGMRHYDVQMIGGVMLHRGRISEMRTGEGKTLVATLAVYLNALEGKGVHVVTVNDYLAKRDAEWMGKLYEFLGLSTGIIVHDLSDSQRKHSYRCDITYATNNELGFDYLRDNMKFDKADFAQRELNFAIIDECDSILVDEARTPLIISGPAESSTEKYYVVNKIVPFLEKEKHYTMEEKSKTASLTEEGNTKVEELLKIDNLYDPRHIELLHHIYQALKAHHLYKLDVDYMIKDGEIVIVDEFTGRLMPGRRWSDGLHQAIEAKEGVQVKNENQTLATITFQNFFKLYNKIAGMTGTADTEAVEFEKIYNLFVSVIPTNRDIKRIDHDDIVYKTLNAKFKAITEDIKLRREKGQPVLVGTVSIEKSELLSQALKKQGVPHDVLNAKHHSREAEIIAQAGRKGAVTIATNMAGRGTDIVLGGNPEAMAKHIIKDETSEEFKRAVENFKVQCEKEKQEVIAAGGLYIVGTERHESRRIDNQLRGRAGRQGDPGESCFYLSLEDNLMRIFNGERIQKIMDTLNVPEDEPITAGMVSRAIEGAQRKVEAHNFDIRKHLLDYDNVMNQQRLAIYGKRKKILDGENLERAVLDMMGDVTSSLLDQFVPQDVKSDNWDLKGLNTALQQQFGFSHDFSGKSWTQEEITELVGKNVKKLFDDQKEKLAQFFDQIEKMILLQTIDQRWKEHLQLIDHLKEGIGLRGYAQKDPLVEYKKEAFLAFENLNNVIKSESIEKLYKIQLVAQDQESVENLVQEMIVDDEPKELIYQAPSETPSSGVQLAGATSANENWEKQAPVEKKKNSWKAGPPSPSSDQMKLNRADRRKLEKKGPYKSE
jgi:preprotein translocase subunit SecA